MQRPPVVQRKNSAMVVPMPPSRRGKGAPRRRIFIWATGILLSMVVGGGMYWMHGLSAPAIPPAQSSLPPIGVSVAAATSRDVPIYLTGLGIVQASVTVAIRAQVDGKLQDVLFTEGQSVRKGDVLIKIDPHLYQAAYDQAVAKKAQDQALLIAADKDLIRFKTLELKDFETHQNVDNQQGKVDQLKATIAADQAAIESAQAQLDYTTITAPNDGRVGVRNVDPGNIVHASDNAALVTLTQTRPSAVVFTLPSYTLDDVLDAMNHGPVEVTAFDRDNHRALAAGTLSEPFIRRPIATSLLMAAHRLRRPRRLSAAAGRAAAAGRLPDHPGQPACPARARRPWPRRSRSRWSGSSRRFPASRR
jgi:multidrug efflux system membrane fusion protein